MASQFPPKKGAAFTLFFSLYKNDGSIIANPGTITKKVSIDGVAVADIAASVTGEDTTYGQCSVVLSTSEMNGDAIWVYIKDDTAGCVPFTATIYTAGSLLDEVKTDTAEILADTGTDGVVVVTASVNAVADQVWNEAIADHLTAGSTGELLQDIDYEVDEIHAAVQNIAVTGAPLNTVANGRTLTAGTETGTYEGTLFSNGVYHIITAAASTIDVEYLFTLTTGGVPTSIKIEGYLKESGTAGGDTVSLQVYNYVTPEWDVIDTAVFTGITKNGPDDIKTHNLLARHVGTTGGDTGKMRIRFYSNSLEAGTTLNLDMINVGYAESISTNIALILADTNELQTDLTNGGRIDLLIDALISELAKVPKSDLAVSWNATALAAINAEIVDALTGDNIPELSQAKPSATPTITTALMLLYMRLRNKAVTTGSEFGIYNDAGAEIATKALADNGTSFTESEMEGGN